MFSDPHWLLLLIPGVIMLWPVWQVSKKIFILRMMILFLVVLALSGLQLRIAAKDGAIVIVADRSLSMPVDADKRVAETMELLHRQMPENGRIGLVSFASEARVELSPGRAPFSGFAGELNQEASNLYEAINKALAIIPDDLSGRVVILSDGFSTGRPSTQAAFKASERKIPVDFRHFSRDLNADLAIESFAVPGLLMPGEHFNLSAVINSPIDQTIDVELRASGKLLSRFSRQVRSGRTSLVFRHQVGHAQIVNYRLSVKSEVPDPVMENNSARALAEVAGKKPVLYISDAPESSLYNLLSARDVRVEKLRPSEIRWSVDLLAGFSAVVIDNVAAEKIGMHGMRVLRAWIKHVGGGLFMSGGKTSYGTGGYYQSALEDVLPVSLELRSEHRKLALAMMIVLDRSGSMSAPTRGGRTKMDLANIAAANSLDLLSPLDEFGLLAVDTKSHVVVPLQRISSKPALREEILRVKSMGGGIYVHEGLSTACEMLLSAKASSRHIILFADAADAEQPGRYWELLERAGSAGITVSVIGLGTEEDPDANLLRKIAAEGKGRIFFTRDPEELPRLFAQDTFVAARSTFIEDPSSVNLLPSLALFSDKSYSSALPMTGYNLCYAKPDAFIAGVSADENAAPILSGWQFGLGRVFAFCGEIDNASGSFVENADSSDLLVSACNWVLTDSRQSLDRMPITQSIAAGIWKAVLHLDPEREREPFSEEPKVTVVRSFIGEDPVREELKMKWENADALSVELPMLGNESVVALVEASGDKKARLHPICPIYSQEFSPRDRSEGIKTLQQIAAISGGKEMIDVSGAWESMPRRTQLRNISDRLIFLAILLLILEVAERRMALLTLMMVAVKSRKKKPVPVMPKSQEDAATPKDGSGFTAEYVQPGAKTEASDESAESEGFSSALKDAKNKAGRRHR